MVTVPRGFVFAVQPHREAAAPRGETGVIAELVGIVEHIVVTKGDGTHVVPPYELA